MKKFLCMIFLLAWCIPASSQAEGFLNTDESFTLAKAAKVGRGKSSAVGRLHSKNAGKVGESKVGKAEKKCVFGCQDCNLAAGTCSRCVPSRFMNDSKCSACPANAGCDGINFSCNTGYYVDGKACKSCASDIVVANGTCAACNNSSTCTRATCDRGYYTSGGSCKSCLPISVSNGKCVECSSSSICTRASCNSGYYADGGSCKSCSRISIENGQCTTCSSGTKCTSVVCNSGATESGSSMNGTLPSCVKCSSISVSNGSCSECTSAYHHSSYTPVCSKATCNSGYYANGGSCVSCSSVIISNGTCTKCSSGTKCTQASCNSGYYADGGSCKSCSNISVANGTCTACSNGTTCTAITCNSGFVYRKKRDGVWNAGCYPKGTCPTVRPDLSGATCMNVGNNTWQCKTDLIFLGDECSPCSSGYYPKDGGACVSCSKISVSHGTCQNCNVKGTCTKATCNSGYFNKNGTCKPCSDISVANGKCTSCTNDGTCTAMNCDVAYKYRKKRDGVWDAGCYPVGNCDRVLSDVYGATCMNVGNNTYQCKTDDYFSSKECTPCYMNGYRTPPGNAEPYLDKVGFSKPTCPTKGVDNSWKVKNLGSVYGKTCYACFCDGPVLVDGTCCKKGYTTYGGYIECDAGR